MTLADIAEGIEVVETQREREVAAVDVAGESLADRLESCASALPCSADQAADVAREYAATGSLDRTAEASDVTRTIAAKTLHLLGFEGVVRIDPADRAIVGRWIDGEIDRTTACRRSSLGERTFALAVYVETHEPLPAARAAVEPALTIDRATAVDRRDTLQETMSDPTDLAAGTGSDVER
jgi:hypothetical protein